MFVPYLAFMSSNHYLLITKKGGHKVRLLSIILFLSAELAGLSDELELTAAISALVVGLPPFNK